MRTIIAGSRGITDINIVNAAVELSLIEPSIILSGTANGVDKLGEIWATNNGVPVELYPADWNKFGKIAGFIRNELMSANAEALIAIWDGQSSGTKHMINIAKKANLKVHVWRTDTYISDPFKGEI